MFHIVSRMLKTMMTTKLNIGGAKDGWVDVEISQFPDIYKRGKFDIT